MRKLFMFLALVLGVVSCQTEPEGFDVNMGGEQEVMINVSLPEETRTDSAKGFDLTTLATDSEYQLRYILEIYRDGAEEGKNYRDVKYSDDTSVSFPVRLVPGHKYTFAVWADIVKQVENPTDLYYNAASLKSISIIDEKWNAMDEKRDAFTGFAILEKGKSITDIQTINLTRPFAKVRVVTTDIKTIRTFGLEPKAATALYKVPVYTRFDATNASVAGEVNDKTLAFVYNNTYEQIGANELTLFTDYLFVGNNGNITKFNLEVFANAERTSSIKSNSFNTDIAIERNKLTTIKGDVLTEGGNIEVKIENGLDDEIEYPIIDRTEPANNEIWYTSTDGSVVNPRSNTDFGANIISNTYYGGRGIITFDGDVTEIGEIAFNSCDELVSIHIPDSVTAIGHQAFYSCDNLTSVIIPDSVTAIEDAAFYWCISLTSVTIPDSVTRIGAWAFYNCDSLTSVIIPDSVTTIGYAAFEYCNNLTSVTIPDSVTTIEDYTFYNCDSLTSVTIPDSVTTIGEVAFYGCSSLTNVTIPDSVTTIGYAAFVLCSGLREFNGKYASEDGRCLIIDGTLNSFAPAGLTEYTIPNSVTTIGNAAIRGCSGLTSVTIPDSVTTIRDLAFAYCDSLTSVTISDSVTTIGGLAFAYCSNLENIYLYTSTPPTLESSAFMDCSDNLKIYVPHQSLDAYKSAEGWREYADKIFGCPPADEIWYTSTNGQIVTPNSSASFGANIISNTYENGRGVIKFDGVVTEIGYSAFWFASTLKSILIPNSVTKIGSTAFVQCDNLVEIYIPDSVTDIYDHAIVLCDKITTITIGDGVKHIGEEAFANCSNLTTLTIGKNIEEIGWKAFSNCPNLKDIYCKAVTPPVLGWNTNFNNATFYVPAESVDLYKSAQNWSEYASSIEGYNF